MAKPMPLVYKHHVSTETITQAREMDFTQIGRQRLSRGTDETPICSPARVPDKGGLLWGTEMVEILQQFAEFTSLFSSCISEICPAYFLSPLLIGSPVCLPFILFLLVFETLSYI